MVTSAALGAATSETIHAQAMPPAYNIAEITIKDQDGYNKEYLPLITKATTDGGGRFIVRRGKTISYGGGAPAPRVVVVQFENLVKLQALYNSALYRDAIAVGDKYAAQRIFGVEGVSPQTALAKPFQDDCNNGSAALLDQVRLRSGLLRARRGPKTDLDRRHDACHCCGPCQLMGAL